MTRKTRLVPAPAVALAATLAAAVLLAPQPAAAVAHGPAGRAPAAGEAEDAGPASEAETVPVPAGVDLHLLASPASPVVGTVGEAVDGEILDRHGGWLRVRAGGRTGWWDGRAPKPGGTAGDDGPLRLDSSADARTALAGARRHLGAGARTLPLGAFRLVTDAEEHALVSSLDAVARDVRDLYAERYGLPVPALAPATAPDPGTGAEAGPAGVAFDTAGAGTVVLFARPESYRAFGGDDRMAGHTAGRLAAIALDADRRRTHRVLAHELGHLLNRSAFAGEPPVWIDEGLAGDLELFAWRPDGSLVGAPLGLRTLRLANDERPYGALVPLQRLLHDARLGRLETLPELAALDRQALLASPRRPELYALAALWTRFLVDDTTAGGLRRAALFRDHLRDVAASPDPVPLPAELASPALDRTFREWLASLYRRTRKTPRTP